MTTLTQTSGFDNWAVTMATKRCDFILLGVAIYYFICTQEYCTGYKYSEHSLYKVVDQAKESNINLMCSYVSIHVWCMLFLCACVVQGRFILHSLYLHTEINIYLYKLMKQFQDNQTLPLLHTAGTLHWMIEHWLTVLIRPLMLTKTFMYVSG